MTRVEKIKSEINLSKIKKEDKKRYSIYEDSTDAEIIESEVFGQLLAIFKAESVSNTNARISDSKASIEYSTKYEITNESIIDTLRNLYVASKNQFVRSVIASVGKARTFTDKQLGVIVEEIMKLNFNF